jgi:hypothetical protein
MNAVDTHIQRVSAVVLFSAFLLAGCITVQPTTEEYRRSFAEALHKNSLPFPAPAGTKIDSIVSNDTLHTLAVSFSPEFSSIPFRRENVSRIYAGMQDFFGNRYKGYRYSIRTLRTPIEELVPNFYRADPSTYDKKRIPALRSRYVAPVAFNTSRPYLPGKGLLNRNISLWHSHGWYYNAAEDRWEWQRPRLFQSIEDLGPLSFTLPYLVPMLENAGAHVFLPRERDTQTHEVIVDNDSVGPSYVELSNSASSKWQTIIPGFRPAHTYQGNANPFRMGTARRMLSEPNGTAQIHWIPDIPQTGEYAVYISFTMSDSNVSDAAYVVHHAGGMTAFRVNQQIGGGTWQYLGTFRFVEGTNAATGEVVLTNKSTQSSRYITADAVRFGGGMGVIERGGATSSRPKFTEGARYYLQFAGMPDTLVYSLNNNLNDYKDDYQSRSEAGNYLYGAPFGPNKNRMVSGLGIPMDISLAFHTDAGISTNDTTIGTLMIYSVEAFDSSLTFPDGVSRLANRDLGDVMQTQIVDDLRALYDPSWRRRDLRNADYSESVRPNFPGVLLELLSHQNFLDMKFMQDPQFRFDVSRAIYKGILKYLSVQENTAYAVEPLPVSHFSAELTSEGDVQLRWQPTADPLEPTAAPESYIVYIRNGDGGFDNGTAVSTPAFQYKGAPLRAIVSFKVTAVNAGGESFASEVLSACRTAPGAPTAMIVNGFHRVAAPGVVDLPGYGGFVNFLDAGVADHVDYNYPGMQYDFDTRSPYKSNDSPGYGASMADDETQVFAGNTFDYPVVHGASLREAGYSFCSCSAEAVQDSLVDLRRYPLVDLILGKQKKTPRVRPALDSLYGIRYAAFPERLRQEIKRYSDAGGSMFISGSYVGSDLYSTLPRDSSGLRFARETLKFNWAAGHASRTGEITPTTPEFRAGSVSIGFSARLNDKIYSVESPDELAPVQGGSVLLRYSENSFGAAIGYKGTANIVVMGFPFETITTSAARDAVMKGVVEYLKVR